MLACLFQCFVLYLGYAEMTRKCKLQERILQPNKHWFFKSNWVLAWLWCHV